MLITARPAGPTCHTGARSCFDLEPGVESAAETTAPQDFAWLERLWSVIEERARTRPEGSYTSKLLNEGVDATARKVAEEATEVVMAAKDDDVAQRAGTERPTGELAGADVSLALYPLSAFRAMNQAAMRVYQEIRTRGTQKEVLDLMQTRMELYDYLGYHDYERKLDELFAKEGP